MKIVALNGSPRRRNGNTYLILEEMRKGAEKAGSIMEIINLIDCDINICVGCFKCWEKKDPRQIKCIFNDDIDMIFEKILNTDILILGTPLHYDNISATLKIFLERLIQLHTAYIIEKDGKQVHDIAYPMPKIAFLCSCDLPGMYNFDIVSQYMKKVAWNLNAELIAEIYQCEARLIQWKSEAINVMIEENKKVWQNAGYELVTDKKISDKTARLLRTPLIPYKYYFRSANEIADEISAQNN